MPTDKIPRELKVLKRSLSCSGLLGILLPVFAKYVLKEDTAIAAALGTTLLTFAAIHLSYLRRLEKKLQA